MLKIKYTTLLLGIIIVSIWLSFLGYQHYDKIKLLATPVNNLLLAPKIISTEESTSVTTSGDEVNLEQSLTAINQITPDFANRLQQYHQLTSKLYSTIIDFLQARLKPEQINMSEFSMLPPDAYKVMELIYEYAANYSLLPSTPIKTLIFPKELTFFHKLFRKFILIEAIEEANPKTIAQEILRQRIIENLPILQAYLNSDAILHHFID